MQRPQLAQKTEAATRALVCLGALFLAACGDSATSGLPATSPGTRTSNCAAPPPAPGLYDVSIQHQGNDRAYRLYVPASYDPGAGTPVVLNFHGTGGSPEAMIVLSAMNDHADERGILVVYPEGLPAGGLPVFDAGLRDFSAEPRDDVDFARAIVDDVAHRYCVDRNRVYSTGLSNGARMSYRIACEAADFVAAIAPVAGVLSLDPTDCWPSRPVPSIAFHGTADRIAPYDSAGGFSTRSAPAMLDVWAEKNACRDDTGVLTEEGLARCEGHVACAEGADTLLCTIADGGHCWPGGPGCAVGEVAITIDATAVMLDFFERVSSSR